MSLCHKDPPMLLLCVSGQLSITMALLGSLKSMLRQTPPVFLFITTIGETHSDDAISSITPFCTNFLTSCATASLTENGREGNSVIQLSLEVKIQFREQIQMHSHWGSSVPSSLRTETRVCAVVVPGGVKAMCPLPAYMFSEGNKSLFRIAVPLGIGQNSAGTQIKCQGCRQSTKLRDVVHQVAHQV